MSSAITPALKLTDGVEMPALGLGVFQSPPEETTAAVEAALRDGYRLIDTAAAYGNEREVGDAVRGSGLDRSEVFLETKIWISDYGYDETLHGFEKSARKLGVEQIDLLILHQALPSAFERTAEAYRALETLLADGKVRAIGVSNFMVDHLTRLLDQANVVPAVNQIEVHPYFVQPEVQAFGAEHGILTQAWSPIGGITFYRDGEHTSTLKDPVIVEIAQAHGKSPAQVMLRWGLQHGRSVIPKSTKPERIAENIDVFDFELTADEMTAIDGLDTGRRGGPSPRPSRWKPSAATSRRRDHGVPPARSHRRPGLTAVPPPWPVWRLVPHRDRGVAPPVVLGSAARLDGDDEFASRAPVEQVADRRGDLAERIGAVDGRCELARVDELSERHQVFGVLRGDECAELLADERGQQERADLTIDATEPASIGLASDDDEPPPASERAPEV